MKNKIQLHKAFKLNSYLNMWGNCFPMYYCVLKALKIHLQWETYRVYAIYFCFSKRSRNSGHIHRLPFFCISKSLEFIRVHKQIIKVLAFFLMARDRDMTNTWSILNYCSDLTSLPGASLRQICMKSKDSFPILIRTTLYNQFYM